MQHWGWRASFYICAVLGVLVAVVWRSYATNRPEEHPHVNAREIRIIRAGNTTRAARRQVPWRQILSNRSVWALSLSYAGEGYPNYVFYTWFFTYLVRGRGLTVTQGSLGGAAPFLAIALLAPLGGWFSDAATARLGKKRGRQIAVWLGMTGSATLLWTGAHTKDNVLAIALLAFAAGLNLFATATWWATCIDLARDFSGSLSALMNTFGNIGGALSPILTGYIATRLGWGRALDFAALVTLCAAVPWIFVDAGQSVENGPSRPGSGISNSA